MEGVLVEPSVTYQEWYISNATEKSEQKHLDSHIFTFRNANWFLRIYLQGRKRCQIYLYREGFESEHVSFMIWVEEYQVEEKTHTFTVASNNWGGIYFRLFENFIKDNPRMLDKGTLPIFCIIRVVNEPSPTNYESPTPESEDTVPLTTDDGRHVRLIINGKEFRAKPKVLAESSKFFVNKLKDMRWARSIPIKIDGCDPDTFDAFLEFLKNGHIGIVNPDTMIGLYKNSSVCEIPDLQAECIRCMKLKLSVDTFCDIHGLSVVKNEIDLPNYIKEFFIENVKIILESDKWQEYLKSNHLRCNELFFEYLSASSIN